MSHNINKITSAVNNTVFVGSFSGGAARGNCLQIDQADSDSINVIELTRNQATDLRNDISKWLES